jgi:hypothetical protein
MSGIFDSYVHLLAIYNVGGRVTRSEIVESDFYNGWQWCG